MRNYEQIRLLAGLNHVVYANSNTIVAPDTDIYVKLQDNSYLYIGKLNQIGRPGTQDIRNAQNNQIIGTVDSLANQLYVLNTLPSVPQVPVEEPGEASPEQPGGYRRRSTKSHHRRRSTNKRHRRRSTNKRYRHQRTNQKKSHKYKK